jgi:hypothetical protein
LFMCSLSMAVPSSQVSDFLLLALGCSTSLRTVAGGRSVCGVSTGSSVMVWLGAASMGTGFAIAYRGGDESQSAAVEVGWWVGGGAVGRGVVQYNGARGRRAERN